MATRWRWGPSLGAKLMLLSLTLLVVPVFSYRQLEGLEGVLIEAQARTQLLTAEGIASVFNGRTDLFQDLPVDLDDYQALYAHPLRNPVRIDGKPADWEELLGHGLQFGVGANDGKRVDSIAETPPDGGFNLLLGERNGQLYAMLTVSDDRRVYRNPESLRLDNADHVRLSFSAPDGSDGRLIITLPGPGVTSAYHMDPDWRLAADGQAENRVQGHMEPTDDGWRLEFRLPLAMLGGRSRFGLSVVDVDDPDSRDIRSITQTLPTAGKESFNLVVLRSPEVLNIIRGLGYAGARILVIDAQARVRAETGSYQVDSDAAEQPVPGRTLGVLQPLVRWVLGVVPEDTTVDPADSEAIGEQVVNSSLAGKPMAQRRRFGTGEEILMAAHPIIADDASGTSKLIGTVVVEQNTDAILARQREALGTIIVVSVLILLAVFTALLAFSVRLAWRIRNLGTETTQAIDKYGRLRTTGLQREINAGDEIGDLARSVSSMLGKLHHHNKFLENMPRTLRHEINNPLNTLSTSLQNLAGEFPRINDSKYLESAKRGVMRIGAIVQNLADAASLEESLETEDLEVINLQLLLEAYVGNCQLIHPNCEFVFRGVSQPVMARVADYRIEQLLDKIIDNAVDFHRADSAIKVQLDIDRDHLQISVANRGPTLPDNLQGSLFDSMVSHRAASKDNRLHFGLGLYVVRVIAEHHGGTVQAADLQDGSGIVVMVRLPLAETTTRPRTQGRNTLSGEFRPAQA